MGDKMTTKIKYILFCPICNITIEAPFLPVAVGIDAEKLKEVETVIYEQICLECFHNKDA